MDRDQQDWEKPEIQDLGSAEELIQGQNVIGGGDAQFNLLIPS